MSGPQVREAAFARGSTHEVQHDPEYGLRGRCGLRGTGFDWSDRRGPVDCCDCLTTALLDGLRETLETLRAERGRDWSPWLLIGGAAYRHLRVSRMWAEHFAMHAPFGDPVEKLFGCPVESSGLVDAHGWHLVDPLDGRVLAR